VQVARVLEELARQADDIFGNDTLAIADDCRKKVLAIQTDKLPKNTKAQKDASKHGMSKGVWSTEKGLLDYVAQVTVLFEHLYMDIARFADVVLKLNSI